MQKGRAYARPFLRLSGFQRKVAVQRHAPDCLQHCSAYDQDKVKFC
jgi:hypothetical protein